jgi:hypothetical protein
MLPLSSPYTRTKPETGISNISTVNVNVVLTLIWFIISIAAVIIGFWHCRSNAYNYSLVCNETNCYLDYPVGVPLPDFGGQQVNIGDRNRLIIAKEDIIYSDSVAVDESGKSPDTNNMSAKEIASLGLTTSIKYKHYLKGKDNADSVTTNTILFPPLDMGRRKARGQLRKFKEYTSGRTTAVNLQHGRVVTAPGILGIIFGIVSIILALVLGTWQDEKLKRKPWMKSRKRVD